MSGGRTPSLYVAQRAFWAGNTLVRAGDTVVAGHPLLRGRDRLFVPHTPTFPLPRGARPAVAGAEVATAPAGEIRTGPPESGGTDAPGGTTAETAGGGAEEQKETPKASPAEEV